MDGDAADTAPAAGGADLNPLTIRLRLARHEPLRWLTHHEYVGRMRDAVARAELPVVWSRGRHPGPRVTPGPALTPGHTSRSEYLDLELQRPMSATEFAAGLRPRLPEGLELLWARRIPLRTPHLRGSVHTIWYTIRAVCDASRADAFCRADSWPLERVKKDRVKILDLKERVRILPGRTGETILKLAVRAEGTPQPEEILQSVFGLTAEEMSAIPIERSDMRFAQRPYPRALQREYL